MKNLKANAEGLRISLSDKGTATVAKKTGLRDRLQLRLLAIHPTIISTKNWQSGRTTAEPLLCGGEITQPIMILSALHILLLLIP